jgi:hypothetical protein
VEKKRRRSVVDDGTYLYIVVGAICYLFNHYLAIALGWRLALLCFGSAAEDGGGDGDKRVS